MDEDIRDKYIKAGEAVAEAKEFAENNVEEGATWLEVADAVEEKIREKGAEPAFPCNVSANEVAAHDLPGPDDDRVFEEGDVIKLDIGAHIDGWIADSAVTVIVGENELGEELLQTAKKSLDEGVSSLTPGTSIQEVSAAIEDAIRADDFNPVINLTGHRLERYDLHASPSIPNVEKGNDYEFKEGDVFAIEPFVTDGVGMVKETEGTQVYQWASDKRTRFPESPKVLEMAKDRYSKLPFATRWVVRDSDISKGKARLVINQLADTGSLYQYPPLKETSDAIVAQAEHTVLIGEEPEVIT